MYRKKNGIILSDMYIQVHWIDNKSLAISKNTIFLLRQRLNFVKIHRVMSHQPSRSFLLQHLLMHFFLLPDSNTVLHIYGVLTERGWPHIYHRIASCSMFFVVVAEQVCKKGYFGGRLHGYGKHCVYTNMQSNINLVKSTDQLPRKKRLGQM